MAEFRDICNYWKVENMGAVTAKIDEQKTEDTDDHPRLLRSHILHHDYRHPVWKDALPTGKTGSFTFWERIRLTGRTAE